MGGGKDEAGEADLQQKVKEELKERLDFPDDIQIDSGVKIIKDCTFLPADEEGSFKLYLGHAEADIAIYKKSEDLQQHLTETDTFKLWQNGGKEVHIPLVVIEVKRGKHDDKGSSITTDAIRSRTIIAREMNEIFPFTAYYFVADNCDRSEDTLYRGGKHFDNIFTTEEPATGEWIEKKVVDAVKHHARKLEKQGVIEDSFHHE